MTVETTKKTTKKIERRFTKEQILTSKKLNYSRDLLVAILDEDKTYTLKEVESITSKYLKGKVR
ncbi:MAG: hypothetical protein GX366_07310 [Epulopiscium sp.]|nr:hypothetical protein [Candidatus Epulonipiscium sp.]